MSCSPIRGSFRFASALWVWTKVRYLPEPDRVGPGVAKHLAQALGERPRPQLLELPHLGGGVGKQHRVAALVEEHSQAVQAGQGLDVDPHVGRDADAPAGRPRLLERVERVVSRTWVPATVFKSRPMPPRKARKEGTAMSRERSAPAAAP